MQKEARALAAGAGRHKGADVLTLHLLIAMKSRPIYALAKGLHYHLSRPSLVLHADHKVYARHLGYLARSQLGIAAHHHHHGAGVLAQGAVDGLAALVVTGLSNRAGVHHTDVGPLALDHTSHTGGFQAISQRRSLRKIELAAQSDINSLGILHH